MALESGGGLMHLTFACPSCAKEHDLPWSMAGKTARCERCEHQFAIPAPFEPLSPGSSEAIPVRGGTEPPPAPRQVRGAGPPPVEVLVALRTGTRPGEESSEGPPPPPARRDWDSEPASDWDFPANRLEDAERFMTGGGLTPRPRARPAWLIPAIVGGGVSLLLAVNVGLYVAFAGARGPDRGRPVEPPAPEEAGPAAPPPRDRGVADDARPD